MRFAGSEVSFQPQSLQAAASGGGYSAAAGAASINDAYGAQREKAPKYDDLANVAMQTRSQEKQMAMKAEAEVMGAGINSLSAAKSAALTAKGAVKAAKAEAQGNMVGDAIGGVAKIATGLMGLSDERTKTSITPIDSALTKLRELKPVTFYYKPEYDDHTRMHHGFVAQEFRKVLPDATYENSEGVLSIDPIDVIGLLVRANQELESRVTRMEAKLALQAV